VAVVRVPESQPFGRSAGVTGAIDGAEVCAEYEPAAMGAAFERLGRILGAALVSARESFGHEAASDPFNGLYITPVHAERTLQGATAGSVTRGLLARSAMGVASRDVSLI
jgi:hypothetical protein